MPAQSIAQCARLPTTELGQRAMRIADLNRFRVRLCVADDVHLHDPSVTLLDQILRAFVSRSGPLVACVWRRPRSGLMRPLLRQKLAEDFSVAHEPARVDAKRGQIRSEHIRRRPRSAGWQQLVRIGAAERAAGTKPR